MDSETDTLARRLGAALVDRGWMLAAAESCTGGLAAGAITAIAGSSAWFERGFVTYSNAAKEELLGVPAATLQAFGAVSEETARAMADGALRRSRAQLAFSITGIAGPDGGTPDKPVGTVCFGWAWRADGGLHGCTERVRFTGDRAAVREQSVRHALAGVLAILAGGRDGP